MSFVHEHISPGPYTGAEQNAMFIAGRNVSSVHQELRMQHSDIDGSNREQLLQEYNVALLEAFAEVFNVTLQLANGDPAFLNADHEAARTVQLSEHQSLRTG